MVTAAPAAAVLTESASLTAGTAAEPKGIWRSRLIEADVQGSSGFYPAEVLLRDGARAFPAGTHVYFDHPTYREDEERPERSVRDLAGFLVDSAQFEDGPDGRGLFARVQFTESAKNHIRDLASVIGLSIRAAGEVEHTDQGRIVRSIHEGLSVDLVTRAGAGGRLVTMTESAAPESPPDKQSTQTSIPSTTGTGSLLSEVSSMKETLSDRIEQLSVDVARMASQLQESRREAEKMVRENQKLAESITFLRDRQEAVDAKMKESKTAGGVLTELLEANLPLPSMIRIAQSFSPDKDLHEEITQEREYYKKLVRVRESERGSLGNRESSDLGLIESSGVFSSSLSSSTSESDLTEIEDVLSGKMF